MCPQVRGSATLYKWKATYGGMGVSQARKLKVLEDENRRLLADAMLDNAMLKEMASKKERPAVQRKAVEHVRQALEISERLACAIADRIAQHLNSLFITALPLLDIVESARKHSRISR